MWITGIEDDDGGSIGFATLALAAALVAVFVCTPARAPQIPDPLALDPRAPWPWTLLTSEFQHADIGHLISNLVPLLLLGVRVEKRTGPWRFLLLYVVCAVGASLAYVVIGFFEGRTAPAVGASGAVAGIIGAALVLAPGMSFAVVPSWRDTRAGTVSIPLGGLVLLWLLVQARYALMTRYGSIAWEAHVGGLAPGWALARWAAHPSTAGRWWHVEPVFAHEMRPVSRMQAQYEAARWRADEHRADCARQPRPQPPLPPLAYAPPEAPPADDAPPPA